MADTSDPLWFRPSQIAPTTRVFARCKRCLSSRDLVVAELPDTPLSEIERRLRCQDRAATGRGRSAGAGPRLSCSVLR